LAHSDAEMWLYLSNILNRVANFSRTYWGN